MVFLNPFWQVPYCFITILLWYIVTQGGQLSAEQPADCSGFSSRHLLLCRAAWYLEKKELQQKTELVWAFLLNQIGVHNDILCSV